MAKHLLVDIHQIIYFLFRAIKITKKVHSNLVNSVLIKHKMYSIFMNSEYSKISDLNRLVLNLADKTNLKMSDKYISLNFYYTWKKLKNSHKNNKHKISTLTWNDKFELPNGSHLASNIEDYFEFIIRNHKFLI